MYVALLKNSAFSLQISHRSIWKELSLFSRHNFFSSTEYSKSSGSSIHRKNVRSTRTYVKKLECDHYNTHVHTHIRFHVIMIATSSMSENRIERMPRERPDFGWNWSFSQNSMGRRC